MALPHPTQRLPSWRAVLVLAAASLLPMASQAVLQSPVTVRLVAPGGVSFDPTPINEQATVDTTTGLNVGDAGNQISEYWMLDTEFIHFSDNAILLRLRAGEDSGVGLVTGYLGKDGPGGPDPARYEISGLSVAGATIVGLAAYSFDGFAISGSAATSGLVDPAGFHAELVGGNQLNFWLEAPVFRDRGDGTASAYAEFRLDLLAQPVPEPAAWALMLAGLAGAAGLDHRRRAAEATRRAA